MLKVEKRRQEALSRAGEGSSSALDGSLHDVVSRYCFMDLWPCSPKDLDHLARQEWVARNINKKVDESTLPYGGASAGTEKGVSLGPTTNTMSSAPSSKVVYPGSGFLPNATALGLSAVPSSIPAAANPPAVGGRPTKAEILEVLPPALLAFIAHLPTVEGPSPDVGVVLSVLLQSNIPVGPVSKIVSTQQRPGPGSNTSDLSGSSKVRSNRNTLPFRQARDPQSIKRKDLEGQDDDDTATVQSRSLP